MLVNPEGNSLCINNKLFDWRNSPQIWDAFYNLDPWVPRHNSVITFQLPPTNLTILSGVIDELSGYILFRRTFPIDELSARQSPVINEGLALDCYYSGQGYRLYYEFEYYLPLGNENSEVRVYSLTQNNDMIKLFIPVCHTPSIFHRGVGSSENFRNFNGKRVKFITYDSPLFFLKYDGPGEVHLRVRALSPVPFARNDRVPGQYCLNIKSCSKLYKSLLYTVALTDGGLLQKIINPSWEFIAAEIQAFIQMTSQPIPIAPIIQPLAVTTLTAGSTANYLKAINPDFNYRGNQIHYGQFNDIDSTGTPAIPPILASLGISVPFPDGLTHNIPGGDPTKTYYFTIIPGLIVSGIPKVLGIPLHATVTINIKISDTSFLGPYNAYIYAIYYISETSYTYASQSYTNLDSTVTTELSTTFQLTSVEDVGVYVYTEIEALVDFSLVITYIT